MKSTRKLLQTVNANIQDSLARHTDPLPRSAETVPGAKDATRRPIKGFGVIPVDDVVPDPEQPRREFDPEELAFLGESVKKRQLAPIRARWRPDYAKWMIISGERRWRAAKQAGLKTIQCFFEEDDLSDSEVRQEQLIENIHREALKPTEEARAYQYLMRLNGWTAKDLAHEIRVSRAKISRALAVLKHPEDVQREIDKKVLAARVAYEISKLEDDDARREVAGQAIKHSLSHEQVRGMVRQRKGKRAAPRRFRLTWADDAGLRLQITGQRPRTYHEIEELLNVVLEEVRLRIASNISP